MAIPFQIPGQQQYMPKTQPGNEDLTAGGNLTPMNQPMDPVQAQIIDRIMKTVGEEPPVAPPRKQHSKVSRFFINTDPYFSAVSQKNYESTPEYKEYARKMKGYKARQEALKVLGGVSGVVDRSQQADEREARLREQFGMRMEKDRFTPITRQGQDAQGRNTFYNLIHDNFTEKDYDQNGNEVDTSMMSMPIHLQNYPGAQGENVAAPTSPISGVPRIPVPTGAPAKGLSAGAPGIIGTPGPTEGGGPAGGGVTPSNMVNPLRPQRTTHAAPAGAAQQAAGSTAFAMGLEAIIGPQKRAYRQQQGLTGDVEMSGSGLINLAKQNALDFASRNPMLQPLTQSPQYRDIFNYNANARVLLYQYVKRQTGAQFGYKEFENYRGSFPTSMDDEFAATEKMGALVRAVRNEVIATQQQFHGVEVDKRFTQYEGEAAPRELYNQLPADERIAWIAGGGTVTE